MNRKRVYLAVFLCAVVVYLGALQNRFAWDDTPIIAKSDLVHSLSGVWRAFTVPYWPSDWGGFLYRPLTVATFAIDWHFHSTMWFHLVNIIWHAVASVLVAVLAGEWIGKREEGSGNRVALVAGLIFAVHPVHVEAVANVVGRAELMAGVFTLLSVWAVVEKGSAWWSAVAWGAGLLSKENAAVAPGLIAAAWYLGLGRAGAERPTRKHMVTVATAWAVVGLAYGIGRSVVLHPYPQQFNRAPVFTGISGLDVRYTAVAALTDLVRLLVFPLDLRADYSPNERSAVTSPLNPMFLVGLLCLLGYVVAVVASLRRGRKDVTIGLLWIGFAYAPVANLLFPAGVIMAERTLYLPSVGIALLVAAWVRRMPVNAMAMVVGLMVVAGAVRSFLRVPVWRTDERVMLSILEDSPNSYRGPMSAGIIYLEEGLGQKAWDALDSAIAVYPLDGRLYLLKAHAAFLTGRSTQVDSILIPVRRACMPGCGKDFYGKESDLARQIGDRAVGDSLDALRRRQGAPHP